MYDGEVEHVPLGAQHDLDVHAAPQRPRAAGAVMLLKLFRYAVALDHHLALWARVRLKSSRFYFGADGIILADLVEVVREMIVSFRRILLGWHRSAAVSVESSPVWDSTVNSRLCSQVRNLGGELN